MLSPLHGSRQKLLMLGILFGAAVVLSADPARSQNQTFSDPGGRESQALAIEDIGSKGIIAPQSQSSIRSNAGPRLFVALP
jgi:hypothetical protein